MEAGKSGPHLRQFGGVLNVGSLFSGIGGFDLGLERAGMRVAWQCEADPFCRRVLARHWPGVPCYPDVRELRAADVETIDVLCGGFPCQDISLAGRGAGIEGARSGLWGEYARLVRELRPRYVVVENVAALLSRGLGTVLEDLAAFGYDAEWDCLPASAFGAPHRRDRLWLVAYPGGARRWENAGGSFGDEGANAGRASKDDHLANGDGEGSRARHAADTDTLGRTRPRGARTGWPGFEDGGRWPAEPQVGRVVDGFPGRVDQVRSLGNALVPQIAEWLGRRILEADEMTLARPQGANSKPSGVAA